MSMERDPMDNPSPETLDTVFRAIRAFPSQVAVVVLVSLISVTFLGGQAQATDSSPLKIIGLLLTILTSLLSAALGYGISVYVLSGERLGGWAAYRQTNPGNLRLFVIFSVFVGVVMALGDAVLALLSGPVGTIALAAFNIYGFVLIMRYGTVLPAIAKGDVLDFGAARARGQAGALAVRLLVIPVLGFIFLTMLSLSFAALNLSPILFLVPVAIGLALWLVSIYVVLAKAYLGAYR